MDFKQAFITCAIEKKFNWHDRASRSEYWWFYLACVIMNVVLGIFNLIPLLGQLIAFVGGLAVTWLIIVAGIRRLHDIDKSGYWLLVPMLAMCVGTMFFIGGLASAASGSSGMFYFLCFIGVLVYFGGIGYIIYLLVKPGTPGPNRFGPNPLGLGAPAAPTFDTASAAAFAPQGDAPQADAQAQPSGEAQFTEQAHSDAQGQNPEQKQ